MERVFRVVRRRWRADALSKYFFPCILRRVVFGRHKRVDLLQRCVHNHEPPYASAQSGADVRVTDICVSQWL
jgi:hypothetical protein